MVTFERLLGRMHELADLAGVIGLATWDQETFLPAKATAARASQLATLQKLYHQRLVDPALGDWLLEHARAPGDRGAMVRVLNLERERALKVPERLVTELATATAHAIDAWKQARADDVFEPYRPHLTRVVALKREQADAIGHGGERYDALLDGYEPGMTVARLQPVLSALREQLVPMVRALEAVRRERVDPFAGQHFEVAAQERLTLELLTTMGFDLEAGRQDRSVHPFSGGTHPRDVRLTNRFDPSDPLVAVFIALHEGGHGLYCQGLDPALFRTPLARVPSMGLDESQSRLWENLVGRSQAFGGYLFARLQAAFPSQLGGVAPEAFAARVNRVERTALRGQADELTYNLHIVLRYELELGLLRGELEVADLPAAWAERSGALLGLTPPSPRLGVLQDIHWAEGALGYFPTYSLGNLYGASLFAAARRALPDLDAQLREGQLLPLRDWLRERVCAHGHRRDAEALVQAVTGRGLTDEDFIAYLRAKYSALYGSPL
ncbi:MAG: carboxypeptidase M32 [Archangiaceae bacterium]|nr:carboxypeptidase M32 [Archangiaceae bacterium]